MQLKDILRNKGSKVWMIQEDQTIHEALQILVKQKIGALLVVDDADKIAGIISERDIMRGCYANSKELDAMPVNKLMTKNVILGRPEDEIRQVMETMTKNRVRHIPVVADGKLEGIVSIGDVVKALLEYSEYEIKRLKEYMYGPGI